LFSTKTPLAIGKVESYRIIFVTRHGAEIEQAYELAELVISLSAMVNVTALLNSMGFTLARARDLRYNKIQWSMYR
jgi:hypothetical protein